MADDGLPDLKRLKQRYEAARTLRAPFEGMWRDAYRYLMPQRDVINNLSPGQRKDYHVFDSTGIQGLARLVNRIQGTLFPPFQRWFKLVPGPNIPDQMKDALRGPLDDATAKLHGALHRSNFDTVLHEFLLDFGGIGTGAMLFNKGPAWSPFRFVSCTVSQVFLEEGPWGDVGGLFRCAERPISALKLMWLKAVLPQSLTDKLASDPAAKANVIEATVFDQDKQKWTYEVFLAEGPERLVPKPMSYGRWGPWIVSRWMRAANEVYGRGPGINVIPDVKTVNKVVELTLKNASLAISGVYTGVNDGVLNPDTAVFAPGSIIPVARNYGHPQGASLAPLESTGRFDVSQLVLDDLRMNIKMGLMDKVLPPDAGPVRSATEIVARQKELAMDIGPAFGRIMGELVVPIVMRGLTILADYGTVKMPGGMEIDGGNLAVEVLSPLARTQDLADAEALVRWLEVGASMPPQMVGLGVKIEDIPGYLARKLGVDEKLIRTDKEKAAMMQQAQAAQQDAAAAQQPPGPSALPPRDVAPAQPLQAGTMLQ